MLSLNFLNLGLTVNATINATIAVLFVVSAIAPNPAEAQIVSNE